MKLFWIFMFAVSTISLIRVPIEVEMFLISEEHFGRQKSARSGIHLTKIRCCC